TPGTTFRVELFANETLDADGFGPGAVFVGAVDVTTDASGDGAFTIDLTEPLAAGLFVTSTATDADGNTSEFGEGIEVEALMNTTIERAPDPLAMTVAPNPASDLARIVLDGTGEADVLVVDVQGRVVLAETARQPAEVTVPLAGLAPGVYAVRVSSGGNVRSARLTVVR
ncbi:MAG: T9SS type A sorting domain-containing protein, partial [Bacteroidota bacterium]